MAKRFRAELIQDDNSTATAIIIPFDVQKVFGARGRVPVRGTVNGFAYRSSIFTMGGQPFMVVNKQMREGAKAKAGDTVSVVMERDDEPRTVEAPADLKRALKANRSAQAAWDKASYTHRKEYVQAIEDAKKPETRARRIEKAITELAAKSQAKK
ncbi:MAG TPA: YdeI/OmpD-associated family protein [Blastocatellia bacterium]|nr:YdeI/OmpD-associated family protein [Blastocatellia bacterium]